MGKGRYQAARRRRSATSEPVMKTRKALVGSGTTARARWAMKSWTRVVGWTPSQKTYWEALAALPVRRADSVVLVKP